MHYGLKIRYGASGDGPGATLGTTNTGAVSMPPPSLQTNRYGYSLRMLQFHAMASMNSFGFLLLFSFYELDDVSSYVIGLPIEPRRRGVSANASDDRTRTFAFDPVLVSLAFRV